MSDQLSIVGVTQPEDSPRESSVVTPVLEGQLTSSDTTPSQINEDLPQNRIRKGHIPEAWQSKKHCLKERISFLYNNSIMSDVSFSVGRSKQRVHGHKFVLSIGSTVFDRMFFGPLASNEENLIVELPDVEAEAFLTVLKFLYTDEVTMTAECVLSVLYTAKKYAVSKLEESCVSFLQENLAAENAFLLLTQARLYDEPQLAGVCMDCIDKHTASSVTAEGFGDIDLGTLCTVLERDTLRIKEFVLFQSVMRWAELECERNNLQCTAQNRRTVLGRALYLIRFPLFVVEDFACEVVQNYDGLLTDSEQVQLFLYFNISSRHRVHLRPALQFNDTPRCYMTGKQLSAYRFQQIETRWGYNGLSDQIRFSVDRRIYVVGFGLYGGLFGSKEYRVDIQLALSNNGKIFSQANDTFTSDGSKQTFRVKFKEPVEILPNVLYTASATLRGADSYYGSKGQRKLAVECPDGSVVNFTFAFASEANNGTSVEDGQIPEIVFHT